MNTPCDLIINARWILPVEPINTVLDNYALVITQDKIIAIGPQETIRSQYSANKTLDLTQHALIPGLVNIHIHAAMTLLRGYSDDLPLMQWLQEQIWPAEAKHLSEEFIHAGTTLAVAEMLQGGITTCNEMYFYPEIAAKVFDEIGMRAVVGFPMMEFPTPYAKSVDQYFEKGLALAHAWKEHPYIDIAIAPHAPYTVADETFHRIVKTTEQLNMITHIHVHETQQEIQDSLKQYGIRPIERLKKLGVLTPRTIAVHSVHLNDQDIASFQQQGCHVAHCPSSNMKLASGISPVSQLLQENINVGLGTDGTASNNRLDMFEEMRLAALLAKVSTLDSTSVPACTALKMATLNGAKALGLEHKIGSLLPGKQADICAVNFEHINMQPCFDPISHLVYVAGRQHVSDVWVNGCQKLSSGNLMLQMNNKELIKIAAIWHSKLTT